MGRMVQQNPDSAPSLSECPCQTPALGDRKTLPCPPGISGVGLPAPRSEALGGRIQPALPLPRPQPYRTLKESDSAEGDEAESPEQRAREPAGPALAPPDRAASIDLLEDVFGNLDVEVPLQPLGQAKSLEDLRTPKDLREQPGTFDYQVWGGVGAGWTPAGTGAFHTRQVPPCDSERDRGTVPRSSSNMNQVSPTANTAGQASGQNTSQ